MPPTGRHSGTLDTIVGGGDLEPDYLGFLADAFGVPLVYVRGNHDRGGRWAESADTFAPGPLSSGRIHGWTGCRWRPSSGPGLRHGDRRRHDDDGLGRCRAGRMAAAGRRPGTRRGPLVVLSHAPPRGLGDRAADPVSRRICRLPLAAGPGAPPVWLHGHVPPASVEGWRVEHDGTTVVNVTGSVLRRVSAAARPGSAQNGGQGMAGQVGEG